MASRVCLKCGVTKREALYLRCLYPSWETAPKHQWTGTPPEADPRDDMTEEEIELDWQDRLTFTGGQ